jgi:hypothetical protein
MRKFSLLLAGAIGYALGAKAGRTRYEQIRLGVRRVQVQAPVVKQKVVAAADRVRPSHGDRAAGAAEPGWPEDPGLNDRAVGPRTL